MNWLIGIPAWGNRCVHGLLRDAIPSLLAAAKFCPGIRLRFVINTDDHAKVRAAFPDLDITFLPLPATQDKYTRYGDCHRAVLPLAQPGERLMLFCPDMVVSRECFAACERRFAEGKRCIMASTPRTLAPMPPPIGATSGQLLDWLLDHPHPFTTDCFWPEGHTTTPAMLFFQSGDDITVRAFHLSPIAVVNDRPLAFYGTSDVDLPENYLQREIHVVTDPNEFSAAEMSPPEMSMGRTRRPVSVDHILQWASRPWVRPVHWWFSEHRIVLRGKGETDDRPVWDQVLASPLNPLRIAA